MSTTIVNIKWIWENVANFYIVILTADWMYENFVALPDNDGDNYRNFEVK